MVKAVAADKPWEEGTEREQATDARGEFAFSGLRGAGAYLEAKKEGYYAGKASRRSLQSGEPASRGTPLVLTLHRQGDIEPLLHQPAAMKEMAIDGTPVEYDFATGRFVAPGAGQLRAEVRVEGSMAQKFSWQYTITLRGGGFAPRRHEFDFIAPVDGYTDVLEGRIEADAANWTGGFGGDFFVKLPDGRFARGELGLSRGRDIFIFRLRALAINPSGSRNLEHDRKYASARRERRPG